jgi:hypothetical protein
MWAKAEAFTSFKAGSNFVNLIAQPAARQWPWWGHVIFYDSDADGLYARLIAAGCQIEAPPRDAERALLPYYRSRGHELSFAWPLKHE